MLPLTKTLDPADLVELAEELQVVDQHFTKEMSQHPMRRWEYALALRAYSAWGQTATLGGPLYDIGGHGSPFYRMLDPYQVRVVDPQELDRVDLTALLHQGPRLGAAVFCLSVLEHVEDLEQFCYHLACLVAPGGLLFLTMDVCNHARHALDVEDPHHFSWMRRRIFYTGDRHAGDRRDSTKGLLDHFFEHGFSQLGTADWAYYGPHVYDYSFASLALVKRS